MFRPAHQQVEVPDWSQRLTTLADQAQSPDLQAFYSAGAVAPDTPLEQVPFTALDLETTGIDPEQNSILSIGLVPFSLARIRWGESRQWLVQPETTLSAESVQIHQITHADLAAAPPMSQVLPELLTTLRGQVVVVHYRAIERLFLYHAAQRCYGAGLEFPVVDTMELEARVYRKRVPGFMSRFLGHQPKSIRLADARSRFNLPFYPPHHATVDALASAELLQAQVAWRFSPQTPIRDLWR
ncbi:3'-5' exonuclease [Natronospirillum operosum]|uniref:3'-5' exonuclease n=1 Tax=Natronospirillum operosum TaxID=2759953 RepID=A0A4Z0WBP7_9GAMM|nr:3'-5' exonuclease [Natronospirillum operosum]TGG92102.1 3'-5' exonuclease [Natronospirillum operosum]